MEQYIDARSFVFAAIVVGSMGTRSMVGLCVLVLTVAAALCAFGAILLGRAMAELRGVRRRLNGHCAQCGYDLTGNPSGRCPECGKAL